MERAMERCDKRVMYKAVPEVIGILYLQHMWSRLNHLLMYE